MNPRYMFIGEQERSRIKEIVKYANEHPFTIDDLLDMNRGFKSPPGLIEEFQCRIPDGFKVVFSVEIHPAGRVSVLSCSCSGTIPQPDNLLLIMREFGMPSTFDDCKVKTEELLDGGTAIVVGRLQS